MNSADIVVLGIVALFVIVGYIRGFVISIFRLGSFLASLVLAYMFRPTLAEYLMKTSLFGTVKEGVKGILIEKMPMPTLSLDPVSNSAAIDKAMQNIAFPEQLKGMMRIGEGVPIIDAASIYDAMSTRLATGIINTLSFIILIVGLMIVFTILRIILHRIMSLPVLKQADKLGGIGVGVIEGVFVVYVMFAFVLFLYSIGKMQLFVEQIDKSMFASLLYKNNLILNWLKM